MNKTFSTMKALVCAALLVVILISLFMPVVSFNSADKFDEDDVGEIKLGWYNKAVNGADLEHAGKIKVSLISIIFSSGKDVDTLVELYRLGEFKKAEQIDKADLDNKIAAQNNTKAGYETELAQKQQELDAAMEKFSNPGDLSNEQAMNEWLSLMNIVIPKLNDEISKIESSITNINKKLNDELQPELDAVNAVIADLDKKIDGIMNGLSDEDDSRIQKKLRSESFLKKVALRAAMHNFDKDSSYLTFALVISLVSFAVLALDIALKVMKLVKAKFSLTDEVKKSLSDIRLPIVAFILHMFTVQHFVSKTRGIVSLGAGIIVGLVAMLTFAVVCGVAPVLEAKAEGGDKYKKTIIKQSITAGVLVITVIIALLGMRMSALMINDMQRHSTDFEQRCVSILTKVGPEEAVAKASESIAIGASIVATVPIIIYAALGYMLARTAVAEKARLKNSRKAKTPLGSFYIGFIFVAVAYVLSLVLFTVSDSTKRYEMYSNTQMSVVFTEYKEDIDAESIAKKKIHHDKITHAELLTDVKINEEFAASLKQDYKEASDKQTKAEIKSELDNIELEIAAAEKRIDRIESCKKSNIFVIISLAVVAIAAEIAFKMTKYEAEKIASSGKEN